MAETDKIFAIAAFNTIRKRKTVKTPKLRSCLTACATFEEKIVVGDGVVQENIHLVRTNTVEGDDRRVSVQFIQFIVLF